MAQAGWYPDPGGTPGAFRYWDGSRWSEVTTTDPSSAPPTQAPPPPPPPPPSSPGGQQWSAYGNVPPGSTQPIGRSDTSTLPLTDDAGDSGGRGKVLLVLAAVAGIILLIGLLAFLGVRTLAGGDDKTSTAAPSDLPETTAPTQPTPSAPPGQLTPIDPDDLFSDLPSDLASMLPPELVACFTGQPVVLDDQSGNDRITGGGISMPRVPGYEVNTGHAVAFTFADEFTPISKEIEPGWVSEYGVGGLSTDAGTPKEGAEAVMECMHATGLLYSNFERREDVSSEAFDVAGADKAWSVVADIHVNDPVLSVGGDRAQVVVVDTGDPDHYGLYISVVPLGDDAAYAQQEEIAGQLRVE